MLTPENTTIKRLERELREANKEIEAHKEKMKSVRLSVLSLVKYIASQTRSAGMAGLIKELEEGL